MLCFLAKKRFGQIHTYEQWLQPYLVSNTLQLLQSEIPKLRNRIESVQLCFTTDPFMYEFDEIAKMTSKFKWDKMHSFDEGNTSA